MARQRTWMLQLNLDEFNAAFAALGDASEKAEFLSGFARGLNGGRQGTDPAPPFGAGFDLGSAMREKTEGYRESRRQIGCKGGNPNLTVKTNHVVNQMVNSRLTSSQPEVNPILNPLILNLESNDPPPTPPLKAKKESKPKVRNLALPLNAVGGVDLDAFREALARYPRSAYGWNDRTRSYETRTVTAVGTARAQSYWYGLLDRQEATSQELYGCVLAAVEHWKKTEYLWIPNFEGFFGPEKNHWAAFLDRAKEMIAECEETA